MSIFLFVLAPVVTLAQNPLADVVGIPPDSAIFSIPGLGFVNLRNGNLHIEIPIRVVKDRNGTPLTTNITYDSSFWGLASVTGPNGNPISVWAVAPSFTNVLGGNAFSGATNLISSFGSGAAGGHSVFYNMGQSLMAGPLQGIPGGSGPWGASASDLATGAIAGGAFSAVTSAGQTLQGLNGAASLASTGIDAAEFASGVGFVKFGYDGLSYLAGLAHCTQ